MWLFGKKDRKKRKWMTVYKEPAVGNVSGLFRSGEINGMLTIRVKEKRDGSYKGHAFFTTSSDDHYTLTLEFIWYHMLDAKPIIEKYNLFNFDIV